MTVGISNDGELQVRTGNLVDILDPIVVRLQAIGALRYG